VGKLADLGRVLTSKPGTVFVDLPRPARGTTTVVTVTNVGDVPTLFVGWKDIATEQLVEESAEAIGRILFDDLREGWLLFLTRREPLGAPDGKRGTS